MAHTFWADAVDGNFADAANWSAGKPRDGRDAAIKAGGGAYTVTVDSSVAFDDLTVHRSSVLLDELSTGSMTGDSLTIKSGVVRLAGTNSLSAISLSGGVLDLDNAHAIDGSDLTWTGGAIVAERDMTLTNSIWSEGIMTLAAADDATLTLQPHDMLAFGDFHIGTAHRAGQVVWNDHLHPAQIDLYVDYGHLTMNAFLPTGSEGEGTTHVFVAAGATLTLTDYEQVASLNGSGDVELEGPLLLGGNPFGGQTSNFSGHISDGGELQIIGSFDTLHFGGTLHDGHIINGGGLIIDSHDMQGTTITIDNFGNGTFAGAGHNPFNVETIEMRNHSFISSHGDGMQKLDDHFSLIGGGEVEFYAQSGDGFNLTGGEFDANGFSYDLDFTGEVKGSGQFFADILGGANQVHVKQAYGGGELDMRNLDAVDIGSLINDGDIDARGTDLTLGGYSHQYNEHSSIKAGDIFLSSTNTFNFWGDDVEIGMIHATQSGQKFSLNGAGHAQVSVDDGASVTAILYSVDTDAVFHDFDKGTTTVDLEAVASHAHVHWHARPDGGGVLITHSTGGQVVRVVFADTDVGFDNLVFGDLSGRMLVTYADSPPVADVANEDAHYHHDALLDAVGG